MDPSLLTGGSPAIHPRVAQIMNPEEVYWES